MTYLKCNNFSCPSIGWLWSVGRSIELSLLIDELKRAGSYTSMLLSEYLFLKGSVNNNGLLKG